MECTTTSTRNSTAQAAVVRAMRRPQLESIAQRLRARRPERPAGDPQRGEAGRAGPSGQKSGASIRTTAVTTTRRARELQVLRGRDERSEQEQGGAASPRVERASVVMGCRLRLVARSCTINSMGGLPAAEGRVAADEP